MPVSAEVEQIVVTAKKSGAVSVQDIGGAITAIGGNTIDEYQLRDFEDFARFEPSLQFGSQGTGDAQLIIRGIQSPGASTVGLYFGEAVISGSNFEDGGGRSPNIKMYDMERIEILKGPQGTLFGASSMSGTVRLIPNAPDLTDYDAAVGASIADVADSKSVSFHTDFMVNVPVVEDKFAIRAVGWYVENAGFIDHTIPTSGLVLDDANKEKTWGGRIAAKFAPSDNLQITLMALHQDAEVNGVQWFNPNAGERQAGISPPPPPSGIPFAPPFVEPKFAAPYTQEFWDDDLDIFSGVIEYDAGFADFLATANYFERKVFRSFDTSGVAYSFFLPGHLFIPSPPLPPSGGAYSEIYPGLQTQDRSIFSSEVRMSTKFDGPFNFVTGLFYEKDDNFNNVEVLSADTATGIPFCLSIEECIASGQGDRVTFGRTVDSDLKQFAAFFHGTWSITDSLELGAGLRYFDSKQHNVEFITQAVGPPPVPPAPISGGVNQAAPIPSIDVRSSQDKFTYNVDLTWRITEDHLVYFTTGTGFRAGGINSGGLAGQFGVGVPPTFKPDEVTNYEVGTKTAWFDNKLTLNAAVFAMLWNDIQIPGVAVSGATDFIANGTKARATGVELEMVANPAEGLLISLAGSYIDAKLTRDQPGVGIDTDPDTPGVQEAPVGRDGDRIPRVPKWAFSGTAQYTTPISNNGLELVLGADFSYTGKSTTFFNNTDPLRAEIGDYFLLGLNASIRASNWEVGIFVDNVTDEVPIVDIDNTVDDFSIYTARPRTIGLFAKARL